MAEYQITQWHDFPSIVTARAGDVTAKVQLAARFQEVIDEAAMQLGESDADAYLSGWNKTAWTERDGSPHDVADEVARELEGRFDEAALNAMLDALKGSNA